MGTSKNAAKGGGWFEGLTNPVGYILGGTAKQIDPLSHLVGSNVDKWLGTTGQQYEDDKTRERVSWEPVVTEDLVMKGLAERTESEQRDGQDRAARRLSLISEEEDNSLIN